jgi:hypothetical protein
MQERLQGSRHQWVRQHADAIGRLIDLADVFDYAVRFQQTALMRRQNWLGLLCPETGRIYVKPNEDVVETLAHELGHAILESLLPTVREDDESEALADFIGYGLCRWIGYDASELRLEAKRLTNQEDSWATSSNSTGAVNPQPKS